MGALFNAFRRGDTGAGGARIPFLSHSPVRFHLTTKFDDLGIEKRRSSKPFRILFAPLRRPAQAKKYELGYPWLPSQSAPPLKRNSRTSTLAVLGWALGAWLPSATRTVTCQVASLTGAAWRTRTSWPLWSRRALSRGLCTDIHSTALAYGCPCEGLRCPDSETRCRQMLSSQ